MQAAIECNRLVVLFILIEYRWIDSFSDNRSDTEPSLCEWKFLYLRFNFCFVLSREIRELINDF